MAFSNLAEETAEPASPARLTVRAAGLADLEAIMAIERTPGFEALVGRSEEGEHRAMLSAPGFAYRLGISPDGRALAFAILSGLGDPHGNLYLKRIAVVRPGEGVGTAFLASVLDKAFGALGAWRFHLDCFADNFCAQRAYAKLGFSRDGVLRQAYRATDGTRRDLVLMALLSPEWTLRKTGAGPDTEPPNA
jgi:RimJ/RimL family protein N-acetyltransferase